MSDYSKLKELEGDVLDNIFKGRDITKILRTFATQSYQSGFKDGILESNNNWWQQMDKDQQYIDSVSKTDEDDNAKEWGSI
tara:strand:- start:3441 stop:3683 length:243 start_codon:yes stop_codon:yes gene_type:complete